METPFNAFFFGYEDDALKIGLEDFDVGPVVAGCSSHTQAGYQGMRGHLNVAQQNRRELFFEPTLSSVLCQE